MRTTSNLVSGAVTSSIPWRTHFTSRPAVIVNSTGGAESYRRLANPFTTSTVQSVNLSILVNRYPDQSPSKSKAVYEPVTRTILYKQQQPLYLVRRVLSSPREPTLFHLLLQSPVPLEVQNPLRVEQSQLLPTLSQLQSGESWCTLWNPVAPR